MSTEMLFQATAMNTSSLTTKLVLEASTNHPYLMPGWKFHIQGVPPLSDFYKPGQLLIGKPGSLVSTFASCAMTINGSWYDAGFVGIIFPAMNTTGNNPLFHFTQILIIE